MKWSYQLGLTVAIGLFLLAVGITCLTGYVAYSGMNKFSLSDAFGPPVRGVDTAAYGAVFDRGLNWAMKVCGSIIVFVGAALSIQPRSREQIFGSCVVILAGVVLITQHWAAGVALAGMAVALAFGTKLQVEAKEGPRR